MYLPEPSRCMASVTLSVLEEKNGKEDNIHAINMGVQVNMHHRLPRRDQDKR